MINSLHVFVCSETIKTYWYNQIVLENKNKKMSVATSTYWLTVILLCVLMPLFRSRLTSGIVSPSELPDSPTQTVPPSPKPRKTPIEFPTTSKPRLSADNRPQAAPRTVVKPSVFEDNVTKFKEESTPIQFSTATSLSSLTIDDHEEPNDTGEAQVSYGDTHFYR